MSDTPNLRFLFASQLNLDDSLTGFTELPERFRDRFVNARRLAATHVVDAAIEQDVDFVLVSGAVCRPSQNGLAGSRCFARACERLLQYDIPVIWVTASNSASAASGDWPPFLQLPDNVRRIQLDGVDAADVAFEGVSFQVTCGSSPYGPTASTANLVPGQTRIHLVGLRESDDVAAQTTLGPSQSSDESGIELRVTGSPQAKCSNDDGGCCTLVEKTGPTTWETTSLPTGAIVFQRLAADASESPRELLTAINKLAKTQHAEAVCCVDFEATAIASPGGRNEWTHELRRLVADRLPNVWINSVSSRATSTGRDRNGLLDEVLEQFTNSRVQAACESLFQSSSSLCDVSVDVALNWAEVREQATDFATTAIAGLTADSTTPLSTTQSTASSVSTHARQQRRAA